MELEEARSEIATHDFMSSVSYSEIYLNQIFQKLIKESYNCLQEACAQMRMETEKFVSESTFQLPTCRISESTKRLMTLAYDTLIEATKSTPKW